MNYNRKVKYLYFNTTVHPWCCGHSTSISVCGVWGARAVVQVSRREFHTHRREFHTHTHLDYVRVEILSCIKKKVSLFQLKFIKCMD